MGVMVQIQLGWGPGATCEEALPAASSLMENLTMCLHPPLPALAEAVFLKP